MTVVTNVLGTNVAVLDTATPPFIQLTRGEGGPGRVQMVEDQVALTTAFVGATGNYARLCRFPTWAKIKRLRVFSDAPLDSNATQSLALNFGVTFSDSTINGTPSLYQGLIPTTVGIGGGSTTAGTTTSFASYTTPNDCFGTITQAGNNVAIPITDITWGGAIATYPRQSFVQTPLVEIFNFLDGRSIPIEVLGYLDVYVYVKTIAATPHAANLVAILEYCE
jgi:hypothetical protein